MGQTNSTRAFIQRRKKMIQAFKNVPCADCGQRYPYFVMDFDHVRGEKKFQIGHSHTYGKSLERVMEEIEKCDLVCANCHRIRTHKDKQ